MLWFHVRRRLGLHHVPWGQRACSTASSSEQFVPPSPSPLDAFPDVYDSAKVERGWYAHWKRKRLFRPHAKNADAKAETFSLVLPPPNVTGTLHLGHALTVTVQDVLVRWHRMRGHRTLWVPGSDHAGIATQSVVERSLLATRGKTREELGRDAFVEEVWKWKEEKGNKIFEQLERLGASLDWDRTCFTMSKSHSHAVNEAFIRLFDKGLVHRGNFLVNWSCALGSAISDIEVDHVELAGKKKLTIPGYQKPVEFGQIYDISYRIENSDEKLTFSTTRPETVLGDVALAVHPDDSRYSHLVKTQARAVHPLVPGRLLLIVADSAVDPEFGTGVVKVTPAHDKNDFAIGQRHALEAISVIGEDGKMNCPEVEAFHGLPRFDARWRVLSALREQALFEGKREHPMVVPICSRSGDVIEPLIKPQWFLSTAEMEQKALEASECEELRFTPALHHKVWKSWLGNDRDWCISRQLWWGHRIPAYRFYDDKGNELWVAAHNSAEALSKAIEKLGGVDHQVILADQSEDVLDTWFSSAILPFANHGWPENTDDLKQYYPLSLMETGHDILFFWVARMVMLGMELTGELPFKDVLLHGIVCDAHGRKMSKSIGNVIDPLHVINGRTLEEMEDVVRESNTSGHISDSELSKALEGLKKDYPNGIEGCGADALRFGLCFYDVTSTHMNLDINVIKTAGAFGNKIWQASRFLVMAHARVQSPVSSVVPPASSLLPHDKWILSRCAATVAEMHGHLEKREFPLMARCLRRFLYTNLCDVYLEAAKPHLLDSNSEHFAISLVTLQISLLTGIKLLHPLMPFITEELFHRIPRLEGEEKSESIMTDQYPSVNKREYRLDNQLMAAMDDALDIVSGIRGLKKTYELGWRVEPKVIIEISSSQSREELSPLLDTIKTLAQSGSIVVTDKPRDDHQSNMSFWTSTTVGDGKYRVLMDVQGLLNLEKENARCVQRRARLEKDMKKSISKTAKPSYQKRVSLEQKSKDAAAMEGLERSLKMLDEHEVFLQQYEERSKG